VRLPGAPDDGMGDVTVAGRGPDSLLVLDNTSAPVASFTGTTDIAEARRIATGVELSSNDLRDGGCPSPETSARGGLKDVLDLIQSGAVDVSQPRPDRAALAGGEGERRRWCPTARERC
jgi:hypothetical protein